MIPIEPYIITYSYQLKFEGKVFAFRKKELFDLSNEVPFHVKRSEQGWWIGRKLLTPLVARKLVINERLVVDVSDLQWYQQENLNHVFNL